MADGRRFAFTPAPVVDDPRVNDTTLRIACVIGKATDRDGACRIGHVRLMKESRKSLRTVERAIADLVRFGHLTITRHQVGPATLRWTHDMTVDRLREMARERDDTPTRHSGGGSNNRATRQLDGGSRGVSTRQKGPSDPPLFASRPATQVADLKATRALTRIEREGRSNDRAAKQQPLAVADVGSLTKYLTPPTPDTLPVAPALDSTSAAS